MDARVEAVEPSSAALSQTVMDAIGENVYRCYQCVKCTSGCPLAEHFDLAPNQVMRAIQFGDADVLHSRAIWLCASCYTCATRCPQDIDVTGIMDALRHESRRRNIKPAVPEIPALNQLFLSNLKLLGRIHELGLMVLYNLKTGQPLKDLSLGLKMLKRRRFRFVPKLARPPKRVARLENGGDAIGYFPGCALHGSSAEYDATARAVAGQLDLNLVEPPGWVCCGSTPAHATDSRLATVQPMKTIATVEKMGITSLTSPCSSCFARLKASEQAVRDDETTARTVEADTGHAYQGTVTVSHLLDTLLERAGLAKIRARVKKPLSGLKLACYYGCLITRPAKVTGDAHAEYPTKMDDLMRGLGAEPIEWSSKTACCGNSLSLTRPEIAHDLSAKIIREARDCGADAVVTMCPMCHFNLDARQPDIGLEEETPILHATQLMLLAFGESAKAAQLAKNMVDPTTLLKQRGIIGR